MTALVLRDYQHELYCKKCDTTKPLSEFPIDKRCECGHAAPCKACVRKKSAVWYAKNKDKKDAKSKAWAIANPEKILEYLERHETKNPGAAKKRTAKSYRKYREKHLAKDKARREANKEQYLVRERASYAKHKEARAARYKKWASENKDRIAMYAAERRAARRRSTPMWLTDEHYELIFRFYEVASEMQKLTGTPWHVDHIVPLRGRTVSGLHVPWNLQVIPAVDNLKKNNTIWPDMP